MPVVAILKGGMGNQMFQYAAASSLAKHLGTSLLLDLSFFPQQAKRRFELACFQINFDIAPPRIVHKLVASGRLYRQPYFHYDEQFEEISAPIVLDGYWQSERYFLQFSEQVRLDFTFRQPLPASCATLFKSINSSPNSVSVHIRRGDYVSDPTVRSRHGLCDLSYYQAAMRRISEAAGNPHFFLFSDDPAWVGDNLVTGPFAATVVDSRQAGWPDWADMMLMSACRHHIIANSTFSWWGAWLSPHRTGMTCAPSRWFAAGNENLDDLFPKGWVRVEDSESPARPVRLAPTIPKVSVVLPVYNGAQHVTAALDSILAQSFEDFEVLVIDDGSTDSTPDKLGTYQDPRVRIVRNQTNLGLVASLNRGLQLARGDYIARMDADDISLPTRLAAQTEFMEVNPEIWMCGGWYAAAKSETDVATLVQRPLEHDLIKATLLFECPFAHPTVMLRRSRFHESRLYYDTVYKYGEDYDLWSRVLLQPNARVANLPSVLLWYRVHDESITTRHGQGQYNTSVQIRKRLLSALGLHCNSIILSMHEFLAMGNSNKMLELVSKIKSWADCIASANRRVGLFDEKSLEHVLRHRLEIAYLNTHVFEQTKAASIEKAVVINSIS